MMPTVRTEDGVRIAYRVHGEGGLNLLFLHGWSGSGGYWDETLAHLDLTGLRAITLDYRGHGDSDKPETGYTLKRFAQDAFTVADAVGAEKLVVVGFSMSGKFAQYLPCIRPERVLGQILIAGCPASELPFPDEVHRDWVSRAGNGEKLLEVTSAYITQPVRQQVLERFADDAAKASQTALNETLGMCRFVSFADRLQAIRVPTLVVGGLHDGIFSPDVLRAGVVAPLLGARLALLDSNHEVPIEQPRECAALIEAFLAGLNFVPKRTADGV